MPHNAGMAPLRPLIPLALSALLAACAGMPATPGDATGATYIVVRHAEKEDAPGPDPALSSEGQARAERLARRLAGEPLVAVYATCETGAMDESEFDRLSIVRIDRDGRPTLSVTRQDDAGR